MTRPTGQAELVAPPADLAALPCDPHRAATTFHRHTRCGATLVPRRLTTAVLSERERESPRPHLLPVAVG